MNQLPQIFIDLYDLDKDRTRREQESRNGLRSGPPPELFIEANTEETSAVERFANSAF